MSIETFSHQDVESEAPYYFSEEIKRRHEFNEHGPECRDILEAASLDDGDQQLLRKVSANYVTASIACEDNDERTRQIILEYVSSDLKDFYTDGPFGLRRSISRVGDVSILIDGRELKDIELAIMHQLIEPSSQVLDDAGRDGRPIVIKEDEAAVLDNSQDEKKSDSDDAAEQSDLDIYEYEDEPPVEDSHTLMDEIRPITGKLMRLGGKIVHISGVRIKDNEQQKIAS